MHSSERFVLPDSDFYIYEPSTLAREVYLYPLSAGHFRYSAGYRNQRRSFDSFELFYVEQGYVELRNRGKTLTAGPGELALLDCYSPHSYFSRNGWACYWLHFDGPVARAFYRSIVKSHGTFIFSPAPDSPAPRQLMNIYELFRLSRPVDEAEISNIITSILNRILRSAPEIQRGVSASEAVADAAAYIGEHFRYPISLQDLADLVSVSPFYLTRMFRQETGFTPHQYLINIRLSNAKFLLRTTDTTVKNIAILTGWGSESAFCAAFRKHVGMPPSLYRSRSLYEGGAEGPDSPSEP